MMRSRVMVIVAMMLTMVAQPAAAGTVDVPAGTAVPLRLVAPVEASTIQKDTTIGFTVAADVLVGRTVVFRNGASAQGTVTDVGHPDVYGTSAHVRIEFIQAQAVDGRPVRLSPLSIAPDSGQQARDVAAAVAASAAAALLFHSIAGLAAGVLIRGGDVSVPAGAVAITTVAEPFRLTAR